MNKKSLEKESERLSNDTNHNLIGAKETKWGHSNRSYTTNIPERLQQGLHVNFFVN